MEPDRELVILIPGLARKSQQAYGDRLSDGIEDYLDAHRELIESYRRVASQESGRARFEIKLKNGQQKVVDAIEVTWNDLRPQIRPSSTPLVGLVLIFYWFSARMWRSIPATSKPMRRAYVAWILFLLSWYVLTILAFAQFSEFIPDLVSKNFDGLIKVIWLFATMVLASRYVTDGIDGSYTLYCYFKNRDGLYDRVRRRIISFFWQIRDEIEPFKRVTLLAHSFGSAVAVDAIAGIATRALEEQPLQRVELITIGSPLEYLSFREPSIRKRIEQCVSCPILTRWVDLYASTDALCSKAPFGSNRKCTAEAIELGYSELEAQLGLSHDAYFEHPRVLGEVLGFRNPSTVQTSVLVAE